MIQLAMFRLINVCLVSDTKVYFSSIYIHSDKHRFDQRTLVSVRCESQRIMHRIMMFLPFILYRDVVIRWDTFHLLDGALFMPNITLHVESRNLFCQSIVVKPLHVLLQNISIYFHFFPWTSFSHQKVVILEGF